MFVEWLELNGYKFIAIPNSTYTKSWKQKHKNHREGLRAGLPDVLVIIPNKGLAFVEMKRTKGGQLRQNQKEWIEELNKLDNVEAFVAKGAHKAIEFIQSLSQ